MSFLYKQIHKEANIFSRIFIFKRLIIIRKKFKIIIFVIKVKLSLRLNNILIE